MEREIALILLEIILLVSTIYCVLNEKALIKIEHRIYQKIKEMFK